MNKLFELITYKPAKTGSLLSLLMLSTGAIVVPMGPVDAQGVTLDPAEIIVGTQNFDAEDPNLVTSGRNVYILWHESSELTPVGDPAVHEVWLSRSSNRGRDFDPRVNVSRSELLTSEQEVIALSERNVYVVWVEDNSDIWFARSLDRGHSFEPPIKISTTIGTNEPEIAAYKDHVYVVWEAPAMEEIYFVESDDEGATFSSELNISNAAGMSADPEIAVSGRRVIVTWRDEATPVGAGIEILYRQGD
jgi:hypothetical protein